MRNDSDPKNENKSFRYTPEEREQYMKQLSTIYYRYLMGKATDRELKIAEKFSPSLIEKLKEDYPIEDRRQTEKERMEMEQTWKQITNKLNINCALPEAEERQFTEADYRKAYEIEVKSRKRRTFMSAFYRYTAIAAMVAFVAGATHYLGNKDFEPIAQPGKAAAIAYNTTTSQLKKAKLADGTRIELNRGSSLNVNRKFGKKMREVTMKGQVFFDVAKDAKKPFIIDASGINVKVCGTAFEIMSYTDIPEKEVTVYRGRVEVRNPKNGRLLTTLTKGMQIIFNPETNVAEVKTVDADVLTAWREGKLVLHDASLDELRLRLRQHFGKVLVIENHALNKDVRITSSFNYEKETLKDVTTRLCVLFNVQSRIEGNRIIISPMNNI